MTIRKPYTIKNMSVEEASQLDDSINRLYVNKLESRVKRDTSDNLQVHTYQVGEYGESNFSSNGSATVVKSFAFQETFSTIIYANAHAKSALTSAHVTDVTGSGITITLRSISGTAGLSGVTTATISVFWQVIGAN